MRDLKFIYRLVPAIAGIFPIAIGFGAGAESRRPLGIAVIGGMLTSTFLTHIVGPVAYTLFSDLVDVVRKRKSAPVADPTPDTSHPHPAA
jgi:hydrophobic/amphiphilic exporter-1 (mainly G- bacteria), HAE1 family